MSTRPRRSGTKRAAAQMTSAASTNTSNSSRKRMRKSEYSKSSTDTASGHMLGEIQQSSDVLKLQDEIGDIFDAPPNTLIIHACNCQGHWGAGIAKAFKARYPAAHENHEEYCQKHSYTLLDSAQLIPPVDSGVNDRSNTGEARGGNSDERVEERDVEAPKHFVGCLFTSRRYGRQKDTPTRILAATKPAMEDLIRQVDDWNAKAKTEDQKVGEVRMCKINSGLFAVPWEKSKKVLESIDVRNTAVKVIKVVSRAEE